MYEQIRIYIPTSLAKKYTVKVKSKPAKYAEIEKALVGARLPLTVQELLAASTFYSYISLIVGAVVGVYLFYLISPNFIFIALSYFKAYEVIANYGWIISKLYLALGLIVGLLAYKFTKYLILSYPFFVSNMRKGEIELYLPHAINMMYGMAVGGSPAYDIVRTIAESKHIFGELSREFLIIVEMVEVFKKDLHEAIRFVRDTTPSPKLAAFLDNFVFILRGSGEVAAFLKKKSEEYLEEQEISFTTFVEFMGMMAEVYLTIFVLLPLFLLIILIVARLMGQDMLIEYRNGLLVMLPVASIFFVWIIRSSMPLPKIKLKEFEERFEVIKANVLNITRNTFSFDRAVMIKNKIMTFILHPLRVELYEIQLRIVIFHIALIAALVFAIAYKFLRIDITAIIAFTSFMVPLILLIEIRERILRKAENNIPSVFSELAMLNEAGLNIVESFRILSSAATEMGVLSKQISIAEREIELGILVPRAIVRMSLRLKSDVFAKIVPIVVKALETAPTIKDAFYMVAKYAETEILFRNRVRSSMMLYVIIIYMSIAVFLFVYYIVIQNFLGTFSEWNVGGVSGISLPSIDVIKDVFFQVTLVVAALSGIIAGVIGEGKLQAGIKHSYFLSLATYIVFFHLL